MLRSLDCDHLSIVKQPALTKKEAAKSGSKFLIRQSRAQKLLAKFPAGMGTLPLARSWVSPLTGRECVVRPAT